ncbi:uncharacterized protein LACBIDRAFT_305621 [Laccaria bicolor S238N-H82]|uniref:Predicted protein n=1 Tax=Laccaria bicolor (strain S238N-H82 / ATCC MYA-4686) TaxID=486041 RepID=B0CUN9_LACBS|nr:uncharacterized protein LACBIDRAFT_305621 [Laccaria bicolor S238N-H82]EDR14705.1 predicted protein [Laccaria bicolor S238N-H82]|eukprot:XP_001875264.1 predicted protein [Laccaria bicolor S238N-H82]
MRAEHGICQPYVWIPVTFRRHIVLRVPPSPFSRAPRGVPEVLADCTTPLRYHRLRQEATDVGAFVDRRGREAIQVSFVGRPVGLAHSGIPLIGRIVVERLAEHSYYKDPRI